MSEGGLSKPPIGLMPRRLWLENRYQQIMESVARYREVCYVIPIEWLKELVTLREELDQPKK